MGAQVFTIWCNAKFGSKAEDLLRREVEPHPLIFSSRSSSSNLVAGAPDPDMLEAEVVFGQPDPQGAVQSQRLRWIHLTSAGYTAYDMEAFREALQGRGAILTNSSGVYAEPCAEHALSFLMAQARQLPQSFETQRTGRSWPSQARRSASRLLRGQNAVLLGFGAIGRRLAQLLAPFEMKLTALRRKPGKGIEAVAIVDERGLGTALAQADHVVNLLPESDNTRGFVNVERIALMRPGAVFYNVGRGTTVDQEALRAALEGGHLAAAFLDVTDPEPLPPDHPLWKAPNCFITPHSAGGFNIEHEALVRHFLENLRRFESGSDLIDRVM